MKKPDLQELLKDLELKADEKKLKIEKHCDVEKTTLDLLVIYEEMLARKWSAVYEYFSDCFSRVQRRCVCPETLELFLQSVAAYQDENKFADTGLFFSALIQASYNRGHNNFVFSLGHLGKPMDYLCSNIKGNADEPIEIKVIGNVGGDFGLNAQNTIIHLAGDARDGCAMMAKNSKFYLGKAGGVLGWGADDTEINFTGFIDNGVRSGHYAKRCTFRSPNRQALDVLLKESNDTCNFILLENGTEVDYKIMEKKKNEPN